jgi:signal transduction histidine kinase
MLVDYEIPVSLMELFNSLAGIFTRDLFQVEIDRRLGALLRVAGIDLQIVPHYDDFIDNERLTPNQVCQTLQFVDGEYDLRFTFGLAHLSKRSKKGIYDTATTILTDFLKVVSMSGPVALQRFRRQINDKQPPALQRGVPKDFDIPTEGTPITNTVEANTTIFTPPNDAAKLAHRLRNNLTAIMSGSSQLAAADLRGLGEDELLLVKIIEEAAQRQEDFIKRYLLAYGPMRLTLRPIDLGAAIRCAVGRHDSETGYHTQITFEGESTRITSDSELLKQTVYEILKNAHESIGGGSVSLRWSIAERQILIMIRNRGHIQTADFENTFCQPFITSKSGHAGLGLNVARRFACHLGGSIKGLSLHDYTIVTICLPISPNDIINTYNERE